MRVLSLLFVGCLGLACSKSGEEARVSPAPALERLHAPRTPRLRNPELDLLRLALGLADRETARAHAAAADSAGSESLLLAARLAALDGRQIDALRKIEEARAAAPKDPAVYAAGAEIYVGANALESAWSEIARGEVECGPSSELLRARALASLARQGGSSRALELLAQARQQDPALPYAERAWAQAHLLFAKQRAQAKDGAAALEHARAAVDFDPRDVDAQRFLSESLAAVGDLDGATKVVAELVARGEPLQGELASLHKKAGIAALLTHDRALALTHFQAARKLGLSDAELSTGARLLAEEASAQVDQGVAAYEKGEFAPAAVCFRAALAFEPDSLAAKNHLAVVSFKQRDFAGAATLWREVLATAANEKLALPEPVHLNLARALAQSGDNAAARRVLEDYLAADPAGEWSAATKELLGTLEPGPTPH